MLIWAVGSVRRLWSTRYVVQTSFGAAFALITLPVEFDASKRALAWVEARGIVTTQEHDMAKDALKWAALTASELQADRDVFTDL